MKNIAFIISGSGRTFEKLLQFSTDYSIPKILIFREESSAYKRFGKYNIPRYIIKNNFLENRVEACNEILAVCNLHSIDFIFVGFDRLLTGKLISEYNNKMVNIHPSFLPKYKGLNAVYEQYYNDEQYWGCTAHFINNEIDAGKIIYQDKVPINRELNFEDSQNDLFELMCRVSCYALKKLVV